MWGANVSSRLVRFPGLSCDKIKTGVFDEKKSVEIFCECHEKLMGNTKTENYKCLGESLHNS